MRKILVAGVTASALGMPRWGNGSPPGRRRGVAGSLVATVVAVLGLAGAAPAVASPAPSMTTDGNDVNITAAGANGSLDFYWAVNGSATWNPEQVAPPGTLG